MCGRGHCSPQDLLSTYYVPGVCRFWGHTKAYVPQVLPGEE